MKTLKNYLYELTFQLLCILLPIVTTPYVSRVLRVDGVGRYSVSYAIANYFVLFGMLGFASYGNREIAYVRDNEEEKIQTFWEINNTRFLSMGLAILAYTIYVLLVVTPQLRILYVVQGITLAASWIDISWYYTGIEEFRTTAIRSIAVKLTSLVLIFTCVKDKSDLVLYALIIAASTFVGNLCLWKGIIFTGNFKWRRTRKEKAFFHLKRTVGLWIPALAINVYTSLDKVMLGYICGDTQVGLYESSDKIGRMAVYTVTALALVVVPQTSNLYANNKLKELKEKVGYTLSCVIMIAVPITFGIIGISKSIVPWFFGEGYEQVEYLLFISAWLAITLGMSYVFGNVVLIATNREKQYTFAVIVAAIINFMLNLFLIPRFQAFGALTATVISEYTNMLIMMYCARNFFDNKKFMCDFARYSIAAAAMGTVIYSIGLFMSATVLTTMLQIILGVIIYGLILLLIKDKNAIFFLRILINKWNVKDNN